MWRDRTGYTRVIALAAALAAAGSTAATGAPDAGATPQDPVRRKPNIVFILADDLGWAELGCYGQTKIRTPSIDRIAAEGIRFTQHYSGSPVCARGAFCSPGCTRATPSFGTIVSRAAGDRTSRKASSSCPRAR
ncbi:MAG: sulfatase-like hydrolase/transferase [Planctomycetota bacterium]|jgi:hypothetical protein